MRRLVTALVILLAVLVAAPAAATTPQALPGKVHKGTWYFVDKTPRCSDGGGDNECGWVWIVEISGKKIRTKMLSPQANGVATNGWARIQDRRIKGVCTNGWADWACDARRVISASGRPLTPADGMRVSRAVALAQYPDLAGAPWWPYTAHAPSHDDPIELVPCANNTTRLAGQLAREAKYPVARNASPAHVRYCHGNWAWMAPADCQGDCAYVAHKVKGRWRFAFGIPATDADLATAPVDRHPGALTRTYPHAPRASGADRRRLGRVP